MSMIGLYSSLFSLLHLPLMFRHAEPRGGVCGVARPNRREGDNRGSDKEA